MNEEKTYYEKILVSSGDVPEYYKPVTVIMPDDTYYSKVWLASDGDNFIWTISNTLQVIKPKYWLKPVPSPKQEAMDFYIFMIERSRRGEISTLSLSELYDKYKSQEGGNNEQ